LTLDKLPDHHMAKQYCMGRGIPSYAMKNIVFTDNYFKWCETHIGETDGYVPEDQRIVFPMRTKEGRLYGAQGRIFYDAADKTKRFVTAKKMDDPTPKMFGIERVNTTLPIIYVEGVIDSLFLPNCVAVCGGDVTENLLDIVEGVQKFWVGDNEPRSNDTIKRMQKAIDMGFKVCFWQVDTQYKDINDMIKKGGYTPKMILQHIAENSYTGLKAKTAFAKWRK
jgi:hypothetical protein